MNILKKTLISAGLLVLMAVLPAHVTATHIVGGQLTYKCLGDDNFEVTLTVRRDCINGADDAPFDDPAAVGIFDKFGFLQFSMGENGKLQMPLVSFRQLDTSLADDCTFDPSNGAVCVEEAIYRDTIKLPWNKIGYFLAYQRCCRNGILSNILDPLETGATYYSEVTTQTLLECNSQPVFQDWPEIYICAGEKFTFNHTAIDPDGDELVYRFCTPSLGATIDNPNPESPSSPPYATITWQNGYSTVDMFGPAGDISIDSNNGMTMGTANVLGTYLIGVCVDEFRNGVLLSTTRRDFEYNVVSCSAPIVLDCELRGNDCDGDNTISFLNRTVGADTYKWHFDFPNTDPAFMSTDPSPTFTYPSAGKYTIRKEATRSSDGCSVHEDFIVTTGSMNQLTADFSAEFVSCINGNLVSLTDLSVDPTNMTCAVAWSWNVSLDGIPITLDSNPVVFDAGNAQQATVTLTVLNSAGCESTVTKTINLSDLFPSSSLETLLLNCDNDNYELQLSNVSNSSVATLTNTSWTITQNGTTTNFSGTPITITTPGGPLSVTIASEYGNGCSSERTFDIDENFYLPVVDIINTGGGICTSASNFTFSPQISGGAVNGNIVSYLWTDNNGVTYTSEDISLAIADGETITLDLEVTYSNGCVFAKSTHGTNPGPYTFTANVAPVLTITPVIDCNATGSTASLTLTDNTVSNSAIVEQTWTVNGVVQQTSGSTFTIDITANDVFIQYDVTYANGCSATFSATYNKDDLIPTDMDAQPILPSVVSCSGNMITLSFMGGGNSANFDETWVINGTSYTGSPVTVTFGLGEQVNVEYTVTSIVGCSTTGNLSFIASDALPVLTILDDLNGDCVPVSGRTVTLSSSETGTTYSWNIDGVTFTEANPQIFMEAGRDVNATLTVILPSGCEVSASRVISANGTGLPNLEILDNLASFPCIAPSGENITFSSSLTGTDYNWIIDGGVPQSVVNPQVTVVPGQQVSVGLTLILPNGCQVSASRIVTVPAVGGGGDVDILDNLASFPCIAPSGQTITLSSSLAGTDYNWSIDGVTQTVANPQITMVPGQQVSVELTLILPDGCQVSASRIITAPATGGGGNVTINNNLGNAPCIGPNGQSVILTASSGASIDSYEWNCTVSGGVAQRGTGPTISFDIFPGQVIICTLVVTFADGCTTTVTERIDANEAAELLDIVRTEDCTDPSAPVITLSHNPTIGGVAVSGYEWLVNGVASSANSVSFPLSTMTGGVNVSLVVTYTNGCTASYIETFDPSLLNPNFSYTATKLECVDGEVVYEFSLDDGDPLCLDIASITWTINGMTYTGNPVIVQLPVPGEFEVDVNVVYTDGSTFGSGTNLPNIITDGDITFSPVTINPATPLADCDGDVELMVVNPLPGAEYVWTDEDGNIIEIGTTLTTNTGIVGDSISVGFINDQDCIFGFGGISIESTAIDLAIDSLYIICPGDTTSIYCINSNNLNQIITYEWKPAEQLISGETENCPTIGIPETQTEDFSLVLCTTNQFGCTSTDTIDFQISTIVDESFSFAPDSCGSFTYNFFAPPGANLEGLTWSFGDGSTSTEQNPTYTYMDEGNYTVTLDSEGVCLGDIPTVELAVPAFPILEIGIDTVEYTFGSPAVVTATTNQDPDNIIWCNASGDPIGTGNPLEYNPVEDPETVFAKVTDQFGCETITEVVLTSNTSVNPPPSQADITACENEEVMIPFDIGDNNPEVLSYVWEPADCIVSGGTTANPVVASPQNKTFTVLLTNTVTGESVTSEVNLIIENVEIGIYADNGIPDQEGLPQVCQGSNIGLSADPFDPNCSYTWSDGSAGDSIVVAPMETTTYTVTCITPNGCEASASAEIEVMPPQCNEDDVFIPNAFSPNGDNNNDQLFVRSKFIREMEFFVVDRWGEEVWRTNNQNEGWDGSYEGETLQPDTYAYCLKVTCVNDQVYKKSGNVSILK